MDTHFIGKPHEWDARRVYSQTGADWPRPRKWSAFSPDRRLVIRPIRKHCKPDQKPCWWIVVSVSRFVTRLLCSAP
jgi:hypothetical protein